jgi:hypothetical protein
MAIIIINYTPAITAPWRSPCAGVEYGSQVLALHLEKAGSPASMRFAKSNPVASKDVCIF